MNELLSALNTIGYYIQESSNGTMTNDMREELNVCLSYIGRKIIDLQERVTKLEAKAPRDYSSVGKRVPFRRGKDLSAKVSDQKNR